MSICSCCLSLLSLRQSYLVSLLVRGGGGTPCRPANLRLQISKEAITPYQRAQERDVERIAFTSYTEVLCCTRGWCWWVTHYSWATVHNLLDLIYLNFGAWGREMICLSQREVDNQKCFYSERNIWTSGRGHEVTLLNAAFLFFFSPLSLVCQTPSQLHA